MPDLAQVQRAAALCNRGAEFQKAGDVNAARLHYLAALSVVPDDPATLTNLCGVLYAQRHFEAAVSVGRRAVAAAPDWANALENLGIALTALNETGKAKVLFKKILQLEPERGTTWFNYGSNLYRENNFKDANAAYARAIDLGYTAQEVLNDYSLSLLALGQLRRGLATWECRWNGLYRSPVWESGIPEWKGEKLDGKHILIHHEQGFGDTLMLCRYIPDLQALGAKVTIATRPELARLLEANYRSCEVVDWHEKHDQDKYHFHSPMLSVLRHLRYESTEIKFTPYLTAPPYERKLPQRKFKVGICWTSGDHGTELARRRRVVPLELFLPLHELRDVQLVSLQKGAEKDIPDLGLESIFYDPMGLCDDFYDTASVVNELDLVVSVDSAIVHLAGAMGKPVMMLGPFTRCWRWWGKGTGRPWYDNFQIFQQSADGTWNDTLRRVTKAVRERFSH
jgi:tetratricopeptide (TPR) repeat protein